MSNSLISEFLLGAVVLYAAKLYFLPNQKNKYPLPPGPKRLPLVGNLLDLPKGGRDWEHWTKYKDLYGPISSITVFGQNIIILNDEKIANELLDKRSSNHSDRPAFVFAGIMCGWENALSMLHYNDRLRAYRKNIAQYMGSRNAIISFQPTQEEEVRIFLKNVLDHPEKLMDHIRTNAGATILKIMYGYNIEKNANDPLVDLADEVMMQFSLASQTGMWLVDILPFLRFVPDWIPGTGFKKTARGWQKALIEMGDVPYKFVQNQMAAGRAQPSYTSHHLEKPVVEQDEQVIKWSAFSMYAGGSDTTVAAVYGFFLAMLLFPEVLAKAQEEIDTVVGLNTLPTFADRERLPYLENVVLETLRWSTVAPMGLPHVPIKDDIYNGYLIPKGSLILSNIWWTHNDPSVYHEPSIFRPERFSGVDGRAPERDPTDSAFGYGRRICPGRDFAIASLWLMIASSVSMLNISKAKDEQGRDITPPAEWINGVISHPKEYHCKITARSPKAEVLIRSIDDEQSATKSDADSIRAIRGIKQ